MVRDSAIRAGVELSTSSYCRTKIYWGLVRRQGSAYDGCYLIWQCRYGITLEIRGKWEGYAKKILIDSQKLNLACCSETVVCNMG